MKNHDCRVRVHVCGVNGEREMLLLRLPGGGSHFPLSVSVTEARAEAHTHAQTERERETERARAQLQPVLLGRPRGGGRGGGRRRRRRRVGCTHTHTHTHVHPQLLKHTCLAAADAVREFCWALLPAEADGSHSDQRRRRRRRCSRCSRCHRSPGLLFHPGMSPARKSLSRRACQIAFELSSEPSSSDQLVIHL